MKLFNALFHSSLGKKYVMGMTGLALFGFVVGHMLGNLQIFLGPDKINAYGAFLKSMPKTSLGGPYFSAGMRFPAHCFGHFSCQGQSSCSTCRLPGEAVS